MSSEAIGWSPRPLSVLGNTPTRISRDYFQQGKKGGMGSVGQASAVDVWTAALEPQTCSHGYRETVGTCGAGPGVLPATKLPGYRLYVYAGHLSRPEAAHGVKVGQGHGKGLWNLPCPPLIFRL